MIRTRMAPGNFFDRAGVARAMKAADRAAFAEVGKEIRRDARSSMKSRPRSPKMPKNGPTPAYLERLERFRRTRYSKPGEPPRRSRDNPLVWRLLRYRIDRAVHSLVVGPIFRRREGRQTIPEILEYGGESEGLVVAWRVRNGQRERFVERKVVTIEPRPYMRPALRRAIPTIPRKWRGKFEREYRGR